MNYQSRPGYRAHSARCARWETVLIGVPLGLWLAGIGFPMWLGLLAILLYWLCARGGWILMGILPPVLTRTPWLMLTIGGIVGLVVGEACASVCSIAVDLYPVGPVLLVGAIVGLPSGLINVVLWRDYVAHQADA